MSKIKFHLVKLDMAIIFQIVDQCESITSKGNGNLDLYIDNKIALVSASKPEIRLKGTYRHREYDLVLFIRGKKTEGDRDILQICFDNNKDRDIIYNKILELMSKIPTIR